MRIWRETLYLMICCVILQFYLATIAMACSAREEDIPELEEPIQTPTICLKMDSVPFERQEEKATPIEQPTTAPYLWNDWMDVRIPSGLTAEELHAVMYYDENNYAPYYIEAEREFGVNAIFLYAIAQNESQNGRSYMARTKNNLFGWTGLDDHMNFGSVEECIMYVADALHNNYLNSDGRYFEGYSLWDVSRHYNDNDYWRNLTLEIADTMQNRIVASRNKQSV